MEQVVKDNFSELIPFLEKLNINLAPKNNDLNEIEVKSKCEDDIFKNLKDSGFEYDRTEYQRNFLYDFKDERNKKNKVVCRVRRIRNLSDASQDIVLTLKKKIETNDNFKEQLELETVVNEDNLENLDFSLNDSGLEIKFLYEKFRHIFYKDDLNVEISVDVLPLIGRFIEIEGSREDIKKASMLLGINDESLSDSSYINLLKSHNRGDGKEYRFAQYDSFLIAEREIMYISQYWPMCMGCSHSSCGSCGGSCHSCGK